MRRIPAALITVAFTGTLLTLSNAPAQAYWIYHWDGAYSSDAECQVARQGFIDQETGMGQMFTVTRCTHHDRNPETNSPQAGWYYRWGIFAA
ncbi:hypothetical protein [Actinosynnema sp. NPDC023587]|uniref:hypothetical protein n=1 Tax=Actinosynnema sp. NPDC023587 TaxID=3154695 RepID=UPI0033FAB76A